MKYLDSIEFGIVCNEDRQFSIWPAHLPLPSGYAFTGPTGPRTEMLALVREKFVPTTSIDAPHARKAVQELAVGGLKMSCGDHAATPDVMQPVIVRCIS